MDGRYIKFSINVRVDDIKDFDWKTFKAELEQTADKNLGCTSWFWESQMEEHYPTELKPVFCHSCEEEYTHISENGEDFKCLVCESKKIREVIHE